MWQYVYPCRLIDPALNWRGVVGPVKVSRVRFVSCVHLLSAGTGCAKHQLMQRYSYGDPAHFHLADVSSLTSLMCSQEVLIEDDSFYAAGLESCCFFFMFVSLNERLSLSRMKLRTFNLLLNFYF